MSYLARPLVVLALLSVLLPSQAPAATWLYEVRLGVLDHDLQLLRDDVDLENGVDLNVELIFTPAYEILTGTIRPDLGIALNTAGDTSKVYAGLIFEKEWRTGIFIDLAFGGALHDGELDSTKSDRRQLGTRALFRSALEFGYSFNRQHRLSVMIDHISNAELADPNEGLDTLGLRYGYRF